MASKIKKVDIYRSAPANLAEPTLAGAFVSIFAGVCMLILFISEFNYYLTPITNSEIVVQASK